MINELIRRRIDAALEEHYNALEPANCMQDVLALASRPDSLLNHLYATAPRSVFDQCLSEACEYWAGAYVAKLGIKDDQQEKLIYAYKVLAYGVLHDHFDTGHIIDMSLLEGLCCSSNRE